MPDIPSESPFDLGQLERLGIRVLTAECVAMAQHDWKVDQQEELVRLKREQRAARLAQESPAMEAVMGGLQKIERQRLRQPNVLHLVVEVFEQIARRTESINPTEFSLANVLALPEIAKIDPALRRYVAEDVVGMVIAIAAEGLERRVREVTPSDAEDVMTDVIENESVDLDEAWAIHDTISTIERSLRAALMKPPSDTTPPSA